MRPALICWIALTLSSTALAQIPSPTAPAGQSADWLARRRAILAAERAGLDRLGARGGDEAGPSADGSTRFVPLAEVVGASPKAAHPDARDAIRGESADALFELAGRVARGPSPSFAFADECLRMVLDRRPDHAESRRLLGFLPRPGGGWATPHVVDQIARGKVDDPTFGWVPTDWVPHLRRGELPGPAGSNRWLPAAEADALRRDFASGWSIETEHFAIKTDVPLSDVIAFVRKLERFHQLFFALMADAIGPDQLPLAQRYRSPASKPALSRKPRHRVYYFADRDEYARHLAPAQGEGAKKSLGTYFPRRDNPQFGGISYFFNDQGGQLDVDATLYHEASHQLLFESAGPEDYLRNSGQYWVFEGLGTYFETVQVEADGTLRVGGLVGPRIAVARRRLAVGGELIPTAEFVAMNRARFNGDVGGGDIYLHYLESMALAAFLMQAQDARYREGFLDYVRDVYKGRFRGNSGRTLEDRVGLRHPEIDRELVEYLRRGGP